MYRLAIDLGLFGNKSQAKSDQFARKVPKGEREELAISMISRIENYPDEIQVEIKKILLDYLYHNHKPAYYEDARKLFCTVEDGLFQGDPCRSHFLDGYIRKLRKDGGFWESIYTLVIPTASNSISGLTYFRLVLKNLRLL